LQAGGADGKTTTAVLKSSQSPIGSHKKVLNPSTDKGDMQKGEGKRVEHRTPSRKEKNNGKRNQGSRNKPRVAEDSERAQRGGTSIWSGLTFANGPGPYRSGKRTYKKVEYCCMGS